MTLYKDISLFVIVARQHKYSYEFTKSLEKGHCMHTTLIIRQIGIFFYGKKV